MSETSAMRDLKDKIILVTGAASGIGRATAQKLGKAGGRLIVCDVNENGLRDLAAELGDACLMAERVDVSDREAMRAFAERVHERVPAVDVLINNAGVGLQGGILDTSLEDWDWILEINLGGVVHGCHFFVPKMVARQRGGHVVNVSSALGYFGAPGVIGYATSKFGVLGLSESLRAELGPRGISVSTICPGIIDTSIIQNTRFAGDQAEDVRARVQKLYRGRKYGPDKVADAIVAAIRRGTPVVPVSPEAWALYAISRFVPRLSGPVGRLLQRQSMG